jgi:stage III sporulation protein AB
VLKVIAALLVIAASGLVGLQAASYYCLRSRQLQALQSALLMMDTEIVYGATPLPAALDKVGKASDRAVGRIFLAAGQLLGQQQGWTATEAWSQALAGEWRYTALKQDDLAILKDFGEGLGASDRSQQHKKITLTVLQLQQDEEKARQDCGKNERLWRYGGFLLGLSIVLLLL